MNKKELHDKEEARIRAIVAVLIKKYGLTEKQAEGIVTTIHGYGVAYAKTFLSIGEI